MCFYCFIMAFLQVVYIRSSYIVVQRNKSAIPKLRKRLQLHQESSTNQVEFCKLLIGASMSEPHTDSNRVNCGMSVAFLKVYTTNTESPQLLVVYSTMVQASHSRKFVLAARKDTVSSLFNRGT